MPRTLWNSLLTSSVMVGAALVVSDAAIADLAIAPSAPAKPIATETPEATEDRKAAIEKRSTVSTIPLLATESAELTGPTVADLEVHPPATNRKETLSGMNVETPIPRVEVESALAPTAFQSSGFLREVNPKSNIQNPKSNDSLPISAPIPNDASILEQIELYTNETNENSTDALEQVTNVTQLRDVSPGDWAFEALRSLVERYGCIAGYPDGTYRGNRAMTRYEFAAGLNACLQQVERLIANSGEGFVRQEDLVTLQRLVDEFGLELASLRGRVDGLEARTNELELTQFSTTTKLDGEVIFGLTGIATGDNVFGEPVDDVTILGSRARLNLETSFTGRDLLRTRLQATGLETFTPRTQTLEGHLAFAGENANNDIEIDALLYKFPITNSTEVVLIANGGRAYDFANTINFLDGDGAFGALTRFGTRNPIYYLVEGSGIGLRQQLGKTFELSLGYLAGDAGNPGDDGGLFNGPYGAMAQLVYKPSDRFKIGFTYINSYNRETLTGSLLSNPRNLLQTIGGLPVSTGDVPQPTPGLVPTTFFAGQQIPTGSTISANTTLPPGTQLDASIALPFALPGGLPFPITVGPITFPPGTPLPEGIPIPAGTPLPGATPIPQDFVLPVPITLTTPGTSLTALVPGTPLPPDNFTGTLGDLLQQPDFAGFPLGFDLNIPIISNSFGLELSWQVSEKFVLGGWVGYTNTSTLSSGNGLLSRGNIESINGALTLAFPDLGKRGNLAGIVIGVEPTVLSSDIEINQNIANPASINNPALIPAALALLNSSPRLRQLIAVFDNPDPDVSLHIEAFYQIRVTDNIYITPGVIWITAPGSLGSNADLVIGTIRTTFRF
ncbi:MAG: iron uptake porin [Cyanobacteriota bacterium]